jgi:hypothetical protein
VRGAGLSLEILSIARGNQRRRRRYARRRRPAGVEGHITQKGSRRKPGRPRVLLPIARRPASVYIAAHSRAGTSSGTLRRWALSSAVEHYLDMVGVRGSIPLAPTISAKGLAASDVTGANSRARNCTRRIAASARVSRINRLRRGRPSDDAASAHVARESAPVARSPTNYLIPLASSCAKLRNPHQSCASWARSLSRKCQFRHSGPIYSTNEA